MALNWPSNPSVGDTYISPGGTIKYEWTGVAWDAVGVQTSGGGGETIFAGVERIVAGSGITVSPSDGTGVVTLSSRTTDTGGGSGGGIDTLGDARSIYELYTGDWAAAFNEAGRLGGLWWVPDGSYSINSPIIITKDGTKFSGDPTSKPKLTFNFRASTAAANNIASNNRFGMWCAAKTRVRGLYFQWSSSYTNTNDDAALLLFQKGDTASGQRDDMDSSVDDCTFSNARHDLGVPGAASITYYGRNMRVTGCTFSSGSGSGDIRAIALSYTPNADDETTGQTLATAGHRKNFVTGNTFHMTKSSICVEAFKGDNVLNGSLVGLMITSNMNDVGGSLLRVNDGVYADAAVITGNSCIRSSSMPYIDVLSGGRLRNSTITGNSFGIADATKNNDSDCISVRSGGEMRDVTITGNAMGAPETACINLAGTYARVIISSNSFARKHGPGTVAIAGGSSDNKAVVIGNIVDGLTLTTGSVGNWSIANNL